MDLPFPDPAADAEPARAPSGAAAFRRVRVILAGPGPNPPCGMSVQADRLTARLRSEGAQVLRAVTNPSVPLLVATMTPLGAAWQRQTYRSALCRAIEQGADVLHVWGASWSHFRDVVVPTLHEGRDAGLRTILRWEGADADRFFTHCRAEVLDRLTAASVVTVPSGHLAEIFRERLGIDPVVLPSLVPDPVDDRPPVRGEGPLRVLCARHMTPASGVDQVVEAAALAVARGTDLLLTLAGDGPARRAVESAARRSLGARVRFLGWVSPERFEALLAETDVLANGSRTDSFPLALADAQSAGVPVASTAVGGIARIVQHGRTGLLTPAGDVDALAHSLATLAADRALLEDLAWRAKVEALRWTWSAVRPAWAQILAARPATAAA